jgi:hypothetical protein
MAKDLATMSNEKLVKRAMGALAELSRRMGVAEGETAPGFYQRLLQRPAQPTGSPEATLQRRLTRPHLPKPDPAYLAAFERTRPREPAPQPTDTETPIYATAPGPSEPAE